MTQSIRYEFTFPHPPERVWAAITDSATIARWLMPNTFAPVLGHRFTFTREPIPQIGFDGTSHCEVIELEPPSRLAYTFVGGGLDTVIRYELVPVDGGTLLRFEHSGFDTSHPVQAFSFKVMGGGWAALQTRIGSLL